MSIYKKYSYTKIERRKYFPLSEIWYKKISDDKGFDRGVYKVTYLRLTEPDENGYYTDGIVSLVNSSNETSLNIINIGVGQGKTTAMYKLIRQYYDHGYKVIVASPYHTLVNKDYDSVVNGNPYVGIQPIPEDSVCKFTELPINSRKPYLKDIAERDIHVMTINLLLGNSGTDNLRQVDFKREYLKTLQEVWKAQEKKVVIIFDEIHESIHNFRPDLIYNLLGWSDLVHQCFFVSATVTEPVKFVAYHVAILTELNIRVIEADRTKLPQSRTSSLDLYVATSSYAKGNLDELGFIFDYIDEFKSTVIHVLCYGKRLARYLSKEFKNRELEHELIVSNNKASISFDSRKSTIGTTLKTGIDINNPEQLYVVILPSDPWISDSVSDISGIFSDGIPSIVQSLARMRNGGRILVVLPRPLKLLEDSIKNSAYTKVVIPNFLEYKDFVERPRNSELEILSGYWMREWLRIRKWRKDYMDLQESVLNKVNEGWKRQENDQIQNLSHEFDGVDLKEEISELFQHVPLIDTKPIPDVHFPSFEDFVISNGQRFITNYSEWYGKYIVPYFIWAALNDQFQNCKLEQVFIREIEYHSFIINTSDVGASIYNFYLGIGENPYPVNDERYIEKWKRLYMRLRNERVDEVKQFTKVIVDGEKKNSYRNQAKFKQGFLSMYFENAGGIPNEFNISGYILHQMHCATQEKFTQDRQLVLAYQELFNALDEVSVTIEKLFPKWLPNILTLDPLSSELTSAFQRLRNALDTLWETDPFLLENTWNKPSSVSKNDINRLWAFWRREFVNGDEFRADDTKRTRAIRNYKFRHRIHPANYLDLFPIY